GHLHNEGRDIPRFRPPVDGRVSPEPDRNSRTRRAEAWWPLLLLPAELDFPGFDLPEDLPQSLDQLSAIHAGLRKREVEPERSAFGSVDEGEMSCSLLPLRLLLAAA